MMMMMNVRIQAIAARRTAVVDTVSNISTVLGIFQSRQTPTLSML
jgi:hypothetical protein